MPNSDSPSWRNILLIYATLFALLGLLCAPYALYTYSWRDTTPRGPLTSPKTWPKPIRDLSAEAKRSGVDVDQLEVFLLYGRLGDTVSTVICRLPESSGTFEFLRKQLELQPVSAEKVERVRDEVARLAPPPEWWASSGETELFASRHLLEGGEGDLYVVARDPEQHRIFIHYDFNF